MQGHGDADNAQDGNHRFHNGSAKRIVIVSTGTERGIAQLECPRALPTVKADSNCGAPSGMGCHATHETDDVTAGGTHAVVEVFGISDAFRNAKADPGSETPK